MRETITMVVTVMAYPAISTKHGETVCVAGIRTDQLMTSSWVRLFPFKVRDMPTAARIHKWDEIEVEVVKASGDHRPESYTPNLDSIRVIRRLGTERSWSERRAVVDPLPLESTMADVERRQAADGLSLAAVRPGEVLDLEVTVRPTKELAEQRTKAELAVQQGDLFSIGDRNEPLEPIPFNFHYVMRYPDEAEPRRLKIIDWEINQAWRKWRHQYPDPEQRIRDKWMNELLGSDRDSVLFVGNMHRFQAQFLLLSVFWPPRR